MKYITIFIALLFVLPLISYGVTAFTLDMDYETDSYIEDLEQAADFEYWDTDASWFRYDNVIDGVGSHYDYDKDKITGRTNFVESIGIQFASMFTSNFEVLSLGEFLMLPFNFIYKIVKSFLLK